jgi:hypothetical protein
MTAPEQPTPDIAKQIRWAQDRVGLIDRGHPLRLGSDNDLMMMRAVLATLEDRDRFAAQRAAEAVEPWKRDCEAIAACLENERRMFMEKLSAATPPPGDAASTRDENERAMEVIRRAAALIEKRKTPPGDAGERARVMELARIITAEWRDGGSVHGERLVTVVADALQSERTAAASQARRETIEECARECDADAGNPHLVAGVRGCAGILARRIRALATPQESAS